jgi:hypothetical protein
MRATVCAVLLALLLGACATTAQHGTKAGTHHRSTGVVRVHTSLEGGPLNPNTHGGVLDNKPMKNTRITVVRSDGRRWDGRTTRAGIRTFRLPPGRYVISSGWCGGRQIHLKVLPERVLPVRYECPLS